MYVGNNVGQVAITKVGLDGDRTILAPVGELKNGHKECVIRSVWSDGAHFDRVLTAGEDGRVCAWHGGEQRRTTVKKKNRGTNNYKPY